MSVLRPYIEPPAATVPVMSVPGGDPLVAAPTVMTVETPQIMKVMTVSLFP